MLVATALCSVLLVGLWTLYSTYADLFDRGQARVERSQLCRALMQQIADDLQSAIQDPIAGVADSSTGEAQRRRFGLAGTSRELRLDVLQVTPRQGNRIPIGTRTAQASDETAARVPELRTIFYTFAAPSGGDVGDANARQVAATTGLIRRELDFETPATETDATGGAAAMDPSTGAGTGSMEAATDMALGDATGPEAAVDDRWTAVPEVVSLEFRYFDGSGWSSSWNSLQRKSLPVAVEVSISLADPITSNASFHASRRQATLSEMDEAEAPAETEIGASPAQGTATASVASSATHLQMIVDLPAAAEYRKSRPVSPSPRRAPARVSARRIAPRRWASPAESRQLPEDWIRTGSR
ncbi:MAG: hypothetical protein JJ992_12585 [Planctomycetes bacterium]|nr:hypothetical protein [Planctomycetota bacterium]